jgi:NitT/TauT family transport system substrate-binding protein
MVKFLGKLFLSFSVVLLAACSSFQAPKKASDPLRVEYTQWWGDYTLIIAKDQGYFDKYGIQVEPEYYDVYSDAYPDLAAGQIDGSLTSIGDAINLNRTTPMKVVGVYDNGGNDAVLVDPQINSVQDLRGKVVGFQAGSQYELTILEMLRSANMGLSDITPMEMNPENALAALKANQVQAAYTWEPYLSEAVSNGYKIIYPRDQLYLYPDTIVFRKSIVDNRPQDIHAFLNAWFDAVDFRQKYPDKAALIIAKYLGMSVDKVQPDNNLKIFNLDDNKNIFDIKNSNSIYSTTKRTNDYLISTGALIQQTNLLELLDPAHLP